MDGFVTKDFYTLSSRMRMVFCEQQMFIDHLNNTENYLTANTTWDEREISLRDTLISIPSSIYRAHIANVAPPPTNTIPPYLNLNVSSLSLPLYSKILSLSRLLCWWCTLSSHYTGLPATLTKLIQYLFPLESGKLCPKCVPSKLTHSPSPKHRTLSHTTSSSLKLGHPCDPLSFRKDSKSRPSGAMKSGLPVLES